MRLVDSIILPAGELSVHAVACCNDSVRAIEVLGCKVTTDVYHAAAEGWEQRMVYRGDLNSPDPGGIGWICPACLKHYGGVLADVEEMRRRIDE